MVESEFPLFLDVVVDHFARKNNARHIDIKITYMTYTNNRLKAGCLIKPSYDIDTMDIRLEPTH